MSIDVLLTLSVFATTIVGLVVFQSRPAKVFGATLLALVVLGLADQEQLISSFANPGLLTLVLLIVCSLALEKTHILRLISSNLMVKSYRKTWLRLYVGTVLSSAVLNNTAIVATLLSPVRNNPYHSPVRLLLPLSYAAILGGTLTLIGTSTNLIVNSLFIDASGSSLSFFSFTAVGICLVVACGITLWCSHHFLPESNLSSDDTQGYFIDARLGDKSPLIGRSIEENGLRHLESLFLVELVRQGRLISPVAPNEVLEANDKLIFSGDITKVMQLTQFKGLSLFADSNGLLKSNLTEVVIRNGSVLDGQSLKSVGFRALFDAAVVAVRRDGERLSGKLGEITLRAGDFLVLAVGDDFKTRKNVSKNFIVLSGVEPETKMGAAQSWITVGGFIAAVGLAAFGLVELFVSLCVLLGLMLFSGALTTNDITRRLPIDVWLVVSAALLLSQVLMSTGTTDILLSLTQLNVADHPYLTLAVIYLCTWVITELVTNNAAAALMFPIAWTLASVSNVSVMPFVMTVAFAASSSFISPYGYQTNLMVFNAGGYRLKDYLKVGLPVSIVYALVVLFLVPYFFPL
ncbi:SLC13 family permease [Enterovibrio makurazakiensis]|uniref:SLC13 family permease n=1 Tax=Enterovibrio makurazakiensis TaxID=2910232 RepID=UPI003D1AEF25